MTWSLWIEQRVHGAERHYYVVGAAPDQPRMMWGPFPTQAAADAQLGQLQATHAPEAPAPAPAPGAAASAAPAPRQWCPQCGRRLADGRCPGELCHWAAAG